MPPWSWMLIFSILTAIVYFLWHKVGPRRAVAAAVLLSLMVPEWIRWELTPDLWLNMRSAVGVASLILYLCHPRSTYNLRLNWCDYAMIGLATTHVLSDCINSGVHWSIPLRVYGEWALPYLAGRVAIQEIGDARWALPYAVAATLILVGFGVVESLGRVNPNVFEQVVMQQREPDAKAPYMMTRFGLKRAYGPTEHPIYYGVLVLLMYPWMCYAAARAEKKQAPMWWRAMPYVCMLGVWASLSRAPILAIPMIAFAMQLVLFPARRIFWAGFGVACLVLLVAFWGPIYYGLELVSREANSRRMVEVAGEKVRFTGTMHRLLMFDAYGEALQRAGLFGYGTERCTPFPPNVPGKANIPPEMHSVDNAFLLYTLRFGYLGFLFFAAAGVAAQWYLLRMSFAPKPEGAVWIAAMLGTLASMAFVLLTVWMPQDFGFFYIFCIGAVGGLQSEQEQPLVEAADAAAKAAKRREHSHGRRRRRRHRDESPASDPLDAGDVPLAEEKPREEASDPERSSRRRRRHSHRHRSSESRSFEQRSSEHRHE